MDMGIRDSGEAEAGVEVHRAGTADCMQLTSFQLVSQKHQILQE